MYSGSILTACLLLAVNAGAPDTTYYLNVNKFAFPLTILPEKRSSISELRLFASKDQGRNWNLIYRGPIKDNVEYIAGQDGVYWFTLVVVYKDGTEDPPDIYKTSPKQIIVVDTVKPVVQLTAERKGDNIVVHWDIQEQNPDSHTFHMEYQTQEMQDRWLPVQFNPEAPVGDHPFLSPGPMAVKVRLSLKDKADNEGSKEVFVPALPPAPPPPPSEPQGQPWSQPSEPRPITPVTPRPPQEPLPLPGYAPSYSPGAGMSYPQSSLRPIATGTNGDGTFQRTSTMPPLPQLMIVKNPQIKLEFDVSKCGPSGVGGVDVYLTLDNGLHWERTPSELKMGVPASLEQQGGLPLHGLVLLTLPLREHIYGITMVVKNGAMVGKPPPQSGEGPQLRVEVDDKCPEADLLWPQQDPARQGIVILSWRAGDRNLDPRPITLEWAATKQGPWNLIGPPTLPNERLPQYSSAGPVSAANTPSPGAEALPTGQYPWVVPSEIPGRVYLRLTVRDLAGNASVAETPTPIVVDTSEPVATNVHVNPN